MLLGSPFKNLEPYDKPFWNIFENSPFSGQNRVNWEVGAELRIVASTASMLEEPTRENEEPFWIKACIFKSYEVLKA